MAVARAYTRPDSLEPRISCAQFLLAERPLQGRHQCSWDPAPNSVSSSGGHLLLLYEPVFEGVRLHHRQEPTHAVVAQPTKLRAGDFVFPQLGGDEPRLYVHARLQVLLHAVLGQEETVLHVFGPKVEHHRPIHGKNQLVRQGEVVGRSRVVRVDPQKILERNELWTDTPENAVRPGISHVPLELGAHHLHFNGVRRRRRKDSTPQPESDHDDGAEDGGRSYRPAHFHFVAVVPIDPFRTGPVRVLPYVKAQQQLNDYVSDPGNPQNNVVETVEPPPVGC